jgi:hypothetical protein
LFRFRRLQALGVMTLLTAALGLFGAGPTQAATTTIHGCPRGAVCIYPRGAGWNGGKPSIKLWSYGPHNLSNQYGHHYVLNNQYDYHPSGGGWAAAMAGGYTGYDATGTLSWTLINYIHRGAGGYAAWANPDLTPINSINLWITGP